MGRKKASFFLADGTRAVDHYPIPDRHVWFAGPTGATLAWAGLSALFSPAVSFHWADFLTITVVFGLVGFLVGWTAWQKPIGWLAVGLISLLAPLVGFLLIIHFQVLSIMVRATTVMFNWESLGFILAGVLWFMTSVAVGWMFILAAVCAVRTPDPAR